MLRRLFLSLLLIYSCSSEEEPTPPPAPVKYTLTTAVNPAEGGTITPASGEYNAGTTVTITASPAAEYVFKDWTGATGTTASTSVVMSSNKSVTANFVKKQYPLTVEIEGEGSVEEEVIKQGLATDYNSGTIVELTAEPTGEWEFVEWTGDITSTENPAQITIDGPKTVKAKFMRNFDYSQPSYYYKTYHIPNLDVKSIANEFGYGSEYGQYDTGVAFADFNQDGYIDISYAINDGDDTTFVTHFLALNDGNGGWKDGTSIISNASDYKTLSSRKTIIGDFNGDNKPDVVRPTGAHRNYDYPYIMLSNDEGYSLQSLGGYQRDSHTISSGDIDNDGDLDLIFSGETSQGILFGYNDGNANFDWEFQLDGLMHAMTSDFLDLNKDGNIDLIISGVLEEDSTGNRLLDGLNIFWGSGNGKFTLKNRSVIWNNNENHYGGPDDFLITDIDKDGNLDAIGLILQQPNLNHSRIEIFKGNSDFTFINKTSDWVDINTTTIDGCCNSWVWLYLDDRDNNGSLDLYDPSKYNGQHFEWNGSMFIRK